MAPPALSALSLRGATPELPDAALDVFTETLKRFAPLAWFHGGASAGRVRIASTAEVEFSEVDLWSATTYSAGFDTAERQVGGQIEGLRLRVVYLWPEPSGWRNQGEAGVANLDILTRLALEGGRDAAGTLHAGNPELVWWDAWPDPPAGYPVAKGVKTAAHSLVRGPLVTAHDRGQVDIDGQSCIVDALVIDAVYGIVRSRC